MTNAREQIFGAVYGHDCRSAEAAGVVADRIIDRLGEEIVVKLKSEINLETRVVSAHDRIIKQREILRSAITVCREHSADPSIVRMINGVLADTKD